MESSYALRAALARRFLGDNLVTSLPRPAPDAERPARPRRRVVRA